MLDHEQRIAALEKDCVTMRRDISYKLDDTNSAVTIIRRIVGNQGQDIREIRNQVKIVNVHLDGIDTRLDGLKEEISKVAHCNCCSRLPTYYTRKRRCGISGKKLNRFLLILYNPLSFGNYSQIDVC